jgi:hypothetical protein
MAVISFLFTPNTDRRHQDRVLNRLKALAEVRSAGRIDSESDDQEISRMCFAESVDPSHVPIIVEELHRSAGVENVAVESRRGLS